MRTVLLLSGVMLLFTPAAVAQESAAAGKLLAEKWCASCHLTAESNTASDTAPSFIALAKDPDVSSDRLSAFLTEPHGGMSGISLSRREIDDLVGYIRSLK